VKNLAFRVIDNLVMSFFRREIQSTLFLITLLTMSESNFLFLLSMAGTDLLLLLPAEAVAEDVEAAAEDVVGVFAASDNLIPLRAAIGTINSHRQKKKIEL
jgi:hypothetical protein